ncbi:alpha/beta hydrolase family protein [Burkholderia multivorans]|uniref:alpha/beta hydrolase family protein n=1 Tax=Burkholderia multivorans TaxID=87883 RepID=UPI0020B1C169|nr:alpha/beta hydrolase [Burkholderia multivorans]MDN8078622.1 alpha/beta hydrolase [Burkholderia multivorans]
MIRFVTRSLIRLAALGLAFALSACADTGLLDHAQAVAAPAGLHREIISAEQFKLTAWSRITNPAQPVHIYIEGDGRAWATATEPSMDPTPAKAIGLMLAAVDPSPNVVYLARPCQFTPMSDNPTCDVSWWTGKRYAADVISAMNAAVDQVAQRAPGQKLDLIGYSGGGAVAVLVAARRTDVESLRTVAGNLDVAYVNKLHGVSDMPESENPIDYARAVARIPQVHFSGGSDTVVPPDVAKRFVKAVGGRCSRWLTLDSQANEPMTHEGAWAANWGAMLRDDVYEPYCRD